MRVLKAEPIGPPAPSSVLMVYRLHNCSAKSVVMAWSTMYLLNYNVESSMCMTTATDAAVEMK